MEGTHNQIVIDGAIMGALNTFVSLFSTVPTFVIFVNKNR